MLDHITGKSTRGGTADKYAGADTCFNASALLRLFERNYFLQLYTLLSIQFAKLICCIAFTSRQQRYFLRRHGITYLRLRSLGYCLLLSSGHGG